MFAAIQKIAMVVLLTCLTFNTANANWWYLGLQETNSFEQDPLQHQQLSVDQQHHRVRASGSGYTNFQHAKPRRDLAVRRYCWNLKSTVLISPIQQRFCLKNVMLIGIAARGAKLGIDECQHQFKFNRWNCTVYDRPQVFGRITRKKTRETAFIHAINSAAFMYEITKSCVRGDLSKCACQTSNHQSLVSPSLDTVAKEKLNKVGHKWSGCSDNVLFGYKLSKKFVDSDEDQHSTKAIEKVVMNIHNNEVGRRIILKNMKQVCKCHGVSGSCSIKVCWKVMPEFRVIGDELMKRYAQAARIDRHRRLVSRYSRHSAAVRHSASHKDELIFIERSPNFCRKRNLDGSVGTSGRMCFHESDPGSGEFVEAYEKCGHLCCGRGFHRKVQEVVEDCECEFQWCCSVKCKKCKKQVVQYFCN